MKAELLSSPSCDGCETLPEEFLLQSAYPNPFNGKINFDFDIPHKQAVEFQIFDVRGNLVFDRLILPGLGGSYRLSWDAKDMQGQGMASGVYVYKMNVNGIIYGGKVTYLK